MNCRTRARRSLDREDQVERFTCCRTDWDSKAHVLSMPFLVLRSSEDRNVSISAVSASLRLSAIPSISCRSPRPSKLNRRQSKRAQSPRSFRSHRTVADTGSQGFAMRTDGRDGSRRCGRLIQRACTVHPRQRPVREQSCAPVGRPPAATGVKANVVLTHWANTDPAKAKRLDTPTELFSEQFRKAKLKDAQTITEVKFVSLRPLYAAFQFEEVTV